MQLQTSEPLQQIMLARYYEAGVGRFLSVDPDSSTARPGDPPTWNRYSYAFNNPIRFNDPNGEDGNDVANWVDRQVDRGLSALHEGIGQQNSVTMVVNDVATAGGSLLSGAADMLRVGAATGDAIGSGQGGTDLAGAVSQDVARGAGLFVALGAPAAAAVSGGEAAASTSGAAAGSKVEGAMTQIEQSGAKVTVNPKSPGQEGNVTIHVADQGKINLRVESHPLKPGGPAVRHANVETVTKSAGKKIVKTTHKTE